MLRKPLTWVIAAVLLAGAVFGLLWFEPYRVFTSSHLDEAAPPGVTTLASGPFRSQEHETRGTAAVLELSDGSRVLRLADFTTSDGPDVHVWLTGADGHVALGELQATDGNHNYAIPAGTELADFPDAVIWCDRFDVAFGTATLDR